MILLATACVAAGDVPSWAKDSIRSGQAQIPAQDVVGTIAPGDLAAAGLVWMETDPDFGAARPTPRTR